MVPVPLRPAFSAAAGIGGSFGMPAGGDQIAAVPLTPTGIMIADGTPVRVTIDGAISRQPTTGLLFFCSTVEWQDACATRWADLVSDQPIPAAGLFGFYARAFASWGGGAPGSMEGSDELSLTGPAQGELYAGRAGWECYYELNVRNADGTMKSPYELGPCHTFGGGFVVTVQPNDGGGALILTASTTSLPAAGGSVSFELTAADGSTPRDISWSYVPDAAPAPPAALPALRAGPADRGVMLAAAAERGDVFTVGQGGQLVPGRPAQGGILMVRTPREAAPGPSAALRGASAVVAASVTISAADACAGSGSCTVDITTTGTMVARATVGGVQLSASQRILVSDGGGGASPELRLECTSSVVRGDDATCRASAEPSDATFRVTEWKFTTEDGRVIDGPGEGTEWSGAMVVGGVVEVRALVNDSPDSATATIAVIPRDWSARALLYQIEDVSPGGLPPHPTSEEGQLGRTEFEPQLLPAVRLVTDGPNAGYHLFADLPAVRVYVRINTAALSVGSAFYNLQRERRPGVVFDRSNECTRDDVLRLRALVEAHEGLSRDAAGSHTQRYLDAYEQLARSALANAFEHYSEDVLLPAAGQAAHGAWEASMALHSDQADPLNHLGCNMRYYTSSPR